MLLSAKLRWARLLTVFLILIAMTGCVTDSIGPVPTNSYCAISRPITYDSVRDTAKTVKQVEEHNSRWACVCDNDCPKPK